MSNVDYFRALKDAESALFDQVGVYIEAERKLGLPNSTSRHRRACFACINRITTLRLNKLKEIT